MTEDTKKDDTEMQQDIPAASEGADSPDAAVEPSPEERIAQLEAEAAEFKDKALRALADAENTRRRAERDLGEARRYGAAGLARDLLTVADNLRRALDSAGGAPENGEAAKNLVVGVEMIERELLTAFEKYGIRRLDPLGEKFDPEYHQAMYELETAERPAGTVAEVLQPGYVMHERLLRPAMVAVAKGSPAAPPEDADRVDTTA